MSNVLQSADGYTPKQYKLSIKQAAKLEWDKFSKQRPTYVPYSRVPNKRIGQITVQGGKSVKFNTSIVPNNSIEGANSSKQIIVQCKKVTSIFVFLRAEATFLLDVKPRCP